MNRLATVVAAAFGVSIHGAAAYELATHARITYAAFENSNLVQDVSILKSLGFLKGTKTQLGRSYIDRAATTVQVREVKPFDADQGKMPTVAGIDAVDLRVQIGGWLMRGAVREDDSSEVASKSNTFIFSAQPEPLDDPYENINRWCNHFFDPYRNKPFDVGGVAAKVCEGHQFASAPVWALGASGSFTQLNLNIEDVGRRNHFTAYDARESMWRALTGYDKARFAKVAPNGERRLQYWATTFRALGDVLHLNQDMAQPQHTRNEDHGAGPSAWYEKYMDGRAKGRTIITYDYNVGKIIATGAKALRFDQVPYVPVFRTFADFWSTGVGADSLTGRGLADYSSRGFLTPVHNIGNVIYPQPSPNAASYSRSVISADSSMKAEYLLAPVYDSYLRTPSDQIRAMRRNIFGSTLAVQGSSNQGGLYGFDESIYDDRAALLIPRAVGYSAGLLNYFFRGRLEIDLPDAGFFAVYDQSQDAKFVDLSDIQTEKPGFTRVRLKLKNTTPDIAPLGDASVPQAMGEGVLVAVLKFRRSTCGVDVDWPTDPLAAQSCLSAEEELVVSNLLQVGTTNPVPLASAGAGGGREFTFQFDTERLPTDAWNISLQVVYRGELGDEPDAVVVASKDISEPTFMTFMNSTDKFVVDGAYYDQQSIAAKPAVFAAVRQDCVDRRTATTRIYDDCFNRPDHFFVRAGTSQVTIAANGDNPVTPRRFIRVAFLTDLDKPVALNWSAGDISCGLPDRPLTIPAYRAQVGADDSWSYSIPNAMRGVKGWRNYFCYEDLGIVPTPPDVAVANSGQLGELTVDERKPLPVTITGW